MRDVRGLRQVIQLGLAGIHQRVIAVIVAVPAEIDASLAYWGLTSRGDVLDGQYRVTLGGRFVGPRGDHPVAVGVLELEVDPVLGLFREARRIQLPG